MRCYKFLILVSFKNEIDRCLKQLEMGRVLSGYRNKKRKKEVMTSLGLVGVVRRLEAQKSNMSYDVVYV